MGRVSSLLKKHEGELHKLAEALVEYETLNLDEVREVLAGRKLNRMGNKGEALKSQTELQAAAPEQ
jgi:ATP-dependent metalloprotease